MLREAQKISRPLPLISGQVPRFHGRVTLARFTGIRSGDLPHSKRTRCPLGHRDRRISYQNWAQFVSTIVRSTLSCQNRIHLETLSPEIQHFVQGLYLIFTKLRCLTDVLPQMGKIQMDINISTNMENSNAWRYIDDVWTKKAQ